MILDLICSLETKNSASPSIPQQETFSQVSHITLPRIPLLHFLRKYEDSPTFHDLFDSILGKDSKSSHVEKLLLDHIFKDWSWLIQSITLVDLLRFYPYSKSSGRRRTCSRECYTGIDFRNDFMLIQFPDIIIYSYQY